MKKVIFSLALFLTCSLLGFAQKGISYQAVILDPNPIEIPGQDITGQPFVNGEVSLKFKLFSSTFVQEFEEVHVAKTDAYGLVNVLIGSQNAGAFSALVWDLNPRSMQVWVSFDQGGTYTKVSEQVLTYTPYALYAETTGTAGKLSGTLTIGEGGTGAKTAANARTNLGLGNVDNTADANKPVSIATQSALDAKANELTTYVNNQVAAATIPDADAANKGKIQLAGDLAGTAAAPTVLGLALKANAADVTNSLALKADVAAVNAALNLKANEADVTNSLALKADAAAVNAALNLKANAVDVANELALKANAAETRTLLRKKEIVDNKSINVVADADSDTKYPTVKSIKNYVDTQVAGATIADADASTKGKIQLAGDLSGTAAAPTVPGLALKANASEVTTALAVKADTAYVLTKVAAATIADASSSTKGKIQLAGDLAGTAAAPTVPGLALKADAADVTTALNTKASTSDLTSGLALKANTADMNTALALKAPLASPTFTGTVTTAEITTGALSSTAVTAPTYASAPRTLSYSGSTINWNPTLGLNAAITLTQNSTLSFTAAPPVGSYGTVVLTQDGTGGRTLTLPTLQGATNQVLGSTSTSTVALSTAASSKDILNFYYDGTIVYWNIGQGYGAASTTNSGPTNLASGVTGTLAVGNGGTGATSLSGLVKGNGTGAMTAAVAGTDYQAPLTLSTSGSGAATLVGTTLTIPTPAAFSLPTASASTLGGVKVGTNLSIDGSGVLSADVSATTISGTLAVGKGGTGATTLTGYVKGTGTTAMTASATIPVADVTGAAPLASPALTGTPTAPTAAANTNTTQLATTAFVTSALASSGLPSQSGNSGKFLTTNGTTTSWASTGSSGVPYSGASGAVNLGNYNLTVYGIKIGTSGTDNFALQLNTVIGRDVLVNNTSGYHNIAIGNTALYKNTVGYANIAIGNESQGENSSGNYNTSVGQAALYKNTGNYNTAVGSQAGYFIKSSGNTAVGYNALDGQGDGGGNTGVGYNAGGVSWDNRTYNSTFLGYNAKSQNGLDNVIVIGYNAYTNEHHTIQLGDSRILKLKTSGTIWSNGAQLSSDVRLKTNIHAIPNSLDIIMKLNPVHYNKKNSIESSDYTKTENGFIAQELQKVLPYLVSEGTDKDKILSVDYNSIIPVLTKGIQEQQALIEAQQKQIDEMKLILEKLMNDKK